MNPLRCSPARASAIWLAMGNVAARFVVLVVYNWRMAKIHILPNNSMDSRQSRSPSWDGSQERQFIETVLNQRFNFFVIFVSLIISAAVASRDVPTLQAPVLFFGDVVCFALWATIYRVHRKLDAIMETLKDDENHPVCLVERAVGRGSVRWIIGWGIPGFSSFVLLAAAILSCYGKLAK